MTYVPEESDASDRQQIRTALARIEAKLEALTPGAESTSHTPTNALIESGRRMALILFNLSQGEDDERRRVKFIDAVNEWDYRLKQATR